MNQRFLATTVICSAVFLSVPASAQQGDWEYTGSIYMFMPETTSTIDTQNGPVESKLSFSDALSNLDLSFMGTFEASNDRWSLIADYLLFDLSFGNAAPDGADFTRINTDLKVQLFNGYALYRAYQDPKYQLDLGGGLRWVDVDAGVDLLDDGAQYATGATDGDWVDALLAARMRVQFSDQWFGTGLIDYGGFEDDRETWQILLTAGYRFNENWSVQGGYRHISVENQINGQDFSFDQSGPILGVSYRF
ncbi:porin family protein [Paracoccus sp. Z330]|uniref:Porin family protein n=1 Tax=Paracoccus onchidii TaxID=3017813 RepID=A0ABT4ZI86_9RHOB|nr:porin family protein [Paracoccus onchidii]MDB6178954.1 porin family protein [Paracoccus onchidii]